MRNLSVLEETAVALPEGVRVLDLCVDAVESRTFVVAGDSTATAQLLTYDRAYLLTSTAALPFAASERIAGMHFLMEREQVVVALESGDICTIDSSGAVDTVGTVDARIAAWRWSPDDEVLVLVTGEDRLLLMTADFDVLGESPLAAGQREDAPVSVGWGARETQYQGRDAQPAPESVSRLSGDDDMRVRVSWRGDAQFFAVSFVRQGARALRVFARDGRVHSEGEGAETLEHTLAWKPSGRLIAATARRAHRHEVVFFERNGLRHGEFALRAGTGRVRELSWNAESSVLAVVAETRDGACVQLWADKNYHWYLKQELRARDVVRAVWDPEESLRLTVVCARGFVRVQLHSAAAVAHAASLESNAAACVVDGARVLYTPFAHANVPPPMALHTLDAPMSVRHVAFAAFGAGNGFALLLADQRTVVLYECDAGKARPRELRYVELPADARARQVAWAERDVLVSLGAGGVSVTDVAAGSTRVCAGSAGMGLAVLAAAPLVGQVLAAGAGGRVYSVALDASEPWALAQLPAPCAEVDAVACGALGAVVVGRTARNQLYANSRLLSAACSSFFLRRDMLLFTTTTHCLRVAAADASLVTGAGAADGDGDEAAAGQGEARRRIERGAAIVLAAPAGDAVVFQMPRGNLETVRPRALVLAAVRRMLDAREYRRALAACRANRIDMNVLYDHAPAAFMADVDAFVAQVRECDLLNLFVSGLRDEDVTRTMYPGIGADRGARAAAGSGDSAGKTTAVCRALRPVLQARADAARLLPTVLTTLVCERPPAIDEALGVIAALGADERDAALTHLLFLTDVGTVYDAALGRYDLALALRVAERSQRDPREYLPELRALRALESEELRRFTIDAQLRRPARALGHLCAAYAEGACAWDALVAYVDEHALHRECLALLAGHARAPDMHVAYGDALARDKQWAQAAAAYMLSQRAHAQAVDALVAGRQWQLALALAAAPGSGFGAQRVHDLALRASALLSDHHMFADAARCLLEHTDATEDAVALLVRGALWAEAVRCSYQRGRADLAETTVLPGIDAAGAATDEDIAEIRAAFAAKVLRLREVRATPLALMAELQPVRDDSVDVMSDTASMASQFSTFTATMTDASRVTGSTARRISKTKRKAERRRLRGKKGSVFEESHLVDSLAKLVDRVRVLQPAVRELNLALIQFARAHVASRLQRAFAELVAAVLADGDWVFDQQRILVGEGGQLDLAGEVNADGMSALPRLPKPAFPSADSWMISALI